MPLKYFLNLRSFNFHVDYCQGREHFRKNLKEIRQNPVEVRVNFHVQNSRVYYFDEIQKVRDHSLTVVVALKDLKEYDVEHY